MRRVLFEEAQRARVDVRAAALHEVEDRGTVGELSQVSEQRVNRCGVARLREDAGGGLAYVRRLGVEQREQIGHRVGALRLEGDLHRKERGIGGATLPEHRQERRARVGAELAQREGGALHQARCAARDVVQKLGNGRGTLRDDAPAHRVAEAVLPQIEERRARRLRGCAPERVRHRGDELRRGLQEALCQDPTGLFGPRESEGFRGFAARLECAIGEGLLQLQQCGGVTASRAFASQRERHACVRGDGSCDRQAPRGVCVDLRGGHEPFAVDGRSLNHGEQLRGPALGRVRAHLTDEAPCFAAHASFAVPCGSEQRRALRVGDRAAQPLQREQERQPHVGRREHALGPLVSFGRS